ncbi:MAG TPA: WD40 repeat domain-containing protein [Gemmataceae bacterium]|jgi:WD40 repeat protein|nr:WD40 repeat domain-containing protein [Gemmataceae bacterium]
MPTGTVAVLARIALLLLLPLAAMAEPGPAPHEYRSDRGGFPLPIGALGRLGVPPPLSGFAWTLGWTADGSRFVVVDYSGVTVFDAATGRWIESQAIGTEGRSLYTPLSRDGRLLFLLNGRTGALYDTATADTRTFTLPAPFADPDRKVYSPTLAANCRFLAGISAPTSSPGVAWRYDLAHDRFTRILTDRADLHSVRLAPDGRRIFATGGTAEPELTARDLGGKELWTTRLKSIGTLRAVSADGRRLAISDNYSLTVFNADDGKPLLTIPVDSTTPAGLWGIDLAPDGGKLALAIDRNVTVWDLMTGKVQHRLPHAARMVAFSPDGKSLLTVSAWVQRWDVATGKPAYPMPMLDKPVAPSMLRWSGDGKRLLTVWPGDRRGDEREWKPDVLAVWDVERMEMVWRVESANEVKEAHVDRRGNTVRAVLANDILKIWGLGKPAGESTFQLKQLPNIFGMPVIDFFPDGGFMAQQFTPAGTLADVYDQAGKHVVRKANSSNTSNEWRRTRTENLPIRSLPGVMLESDGKRTDVVTGRPLPPLNTRAGAFALRGQAVCGGSALIGCRIQIGGPWGGPLIEGVIWDALTGGEVAPLLERIPDWALATLSSDGRSLAFVNGDKLAFADLTNLHEIQHHQLPSSDVKAVTFAPDGSNIATAHADGTVLIWNSSPTRRSTWQPDQANRLWASLESAAAAEAWRTQWHLLAHPDRATELLKTRLKAIPAWKDTSDQIALLDHPKYAVREAAARELTARGGVVEGDLRSVWEKTTSPEQRERLEALLNKLNPATPPTGEVLRGLRAVWLLERIGNDDAKQLLATMAGGASGSRVTIEARAALERLK